MAKDILFDIIAQKKIEVAEHKQLLSLEDLTKLCTSQYQCTSMKESLSSSASGIISEFKRRSPSKGWINQQARVEDIVPSYEAAGASAVSILTDTPFFGGSLDDILTARPLVSLPILRKDFIIDPYQIYQAQHCGASAILLIAAALSKSQCIELAAVAHSLNLEVLLEVHTLEEIEYVNENIDMVGVNNRNLGTFHTDINNSFRLAEQLPKDMLLVSESGISDPRTIKELRQAGFKGFLIGETFMKTAEPGMMLKDFINTFSELS